jgi:uncharacterized membrane protein
MKTLLAVAIFPLTSGVHAHESFMPHKHPHPISQLPDAVMLIVVILVLAAAAIIYAKFRRG